MKKKNRVTEDQTPPAHLQRLLMMSRSDRATSHPSRKSKRGGCLSWCDLYMPRILVSESQRRMGDKREIVTLSQEHKNGSGRRIKLRSGSACSTVCRASHCRRPRLKYRSGGSSCPHGLFFHARTLIPFGHLDLSVVLYHPRLDVDIPSPLRYSLSSRRRLSPMLQGPSDHRSSIHGRC